MSYFISKVAQKKVMRKYRERGFRAAVRFIFKIYLYNRWHQGNLFQNADELRRIKVRRDKKVYGRLGRGKVRKFVAWQLARKNGRVCVTTGCGETEKLTIDHIVPVSKGGGHELSNLQLMCSVHNAEKGNR